MNALELNTIHITRGDDEVTHGVSLTVPAGELHVIMGPNGSGKSSLANAVMGHPDYAMTKGTVTLDGEDVTSLATHEKARKGLFLSMQYPPEVPGVSVSSFIRAAVSAKEGKPVNVMEFQKRLKGAMAELGIDPSFSRRGLNEGFSGGEKKRMEILQLLLLEPKYALLDETDSGLDVDALKIVSAGVAKAHAAGTGVLLITHYARMLGYLKPDRVHVMVDGNIVDSGDMSLASAIESEGYARYQ